MLKKISLFLQKFLILISNEKNTKNNKFLIRYNLLNSNYYRNRVSFKADVIVFILSSKIINHLK